MVGKYGLAGWSRKQSACRCSPYQFDFGEYAGTMVTATKATKMGGNKNSKCYIYLDGLAIDDFCEI